MRTHITIRAIIQRTGARPWLVIAIMSVIAGGCVAIYPFAAGNGMDALRGASISSTVALALALSVGKLIGTTSALGAGAPGGVLTPTITVSAGFGLLTLLAVDGLGLDVSHPWNGMVAAMAVGFTVGLRSPVGAIFLIPELVGDYRLVPVIATGRRTGVAARPRPRPGPRPLRRRRARPGVRQGVRRRRVIGVSAGPDDVYDVLR